MTDIKLTRRYPNSRPEDITDAFTRGFENGMKMGRGECHEVMIDKFFRGCGECGYMWEYMYGMGARVGPRFCPSCGRKVVTDHD